MSEVEDIFDYYDYSDWYDYDYADYYDHSQTKCNAGCALSRIVKALKIRKKEENTGAKNNVQHADRGNTF